jgi:hypothetical protein
MKSSRHIALRDMLDSTQRTCVKLSILNVVLSGERLFQQHRLLPFLKLSGMSDIRIAQCLQALIGLV